PWRWAAAACLSTNITRSASTTARSPVRTPSRCRARCGSPTISWRQGRSVMASTATRSVAGSAYKWHGDNETQNSADDFRCGRRTVRLLRRAGAEWRRVGRAAAHEARAPVRRAAAGYGHPALARSDRRCRVLHLPADHCGAYAADADRLRAIWRQYDRLAQLPAADAGGK